MKKSQLRSAILIALFVFTININIYPKVTAPPPVPRPDRFIADVFPNNNNTNIHLLNISALITINASDFYNEIKINFNGKYTVFNPENVTNLTIFLPFSLCMNLENATFGVFVNDTQVPFELFSTTQENVTSTDVNVDFIPRIVYYLPCSITLITLNLTLLENYTYIVNYQFEGWIPEPLKYYDLFYMIYSSETAKYWKGNATERVEYKVFGKIPVFGSSGLYNGSRQVLDIAGGKRFICEWDNAQEGLIEIGIRYDEREYDLYGPTIIIIVLNGLAYVAITSVIVLWIIRRKKKRA